VAGRRPTDVRWRGERGKLRLRGLRSGIWVEHRWAYVFTLRDGKLVRQDGFDDRTAALAALQAAE